MKLTSVVSERRIPLPSWSSVSDATWGKSVWWCYGSDILYTCSGTWDGWSLDKKGKKQDMLIWQAKDWPWGFVTRAPEIVSLTPAQLLWNPTGTHVNSLVSWWRRGLDVNMVWYLEKQGTGKAMKGSAEHWQGKTGHRQGKARQGKARCKARCKAKCKARCKARQSKANQGKARQGKV